ncbi:NAD dependent epimerase/dehydratase family protein [Teladorsagia circumcincta]|uniref:NAD dependent epimerase/dehydratase family protein n=1 Tax=Teladorsagia circumcincta TaxID=45464 RepID=A0A2G9UKU8_TELCI|nr:NAD dependent epimerase/dehydratase family protein [Teladorsagia circumcincta]
MDSNNNDILVLVTGASGYIASHCVRLLLNEGYRVRGTVRSLKNEKKVTPIKQLQQGDRLELVEADLLKEDCWKSVVSGCDYVLHIASPFPIVSDATCVDIAVTGTLNVLRAVSKEPSVKKVVLTSSCAAVNEGHPQDRAFDETSWTDVDSPLVDYYAKSKTLAEKAAWDFLDSIKDANNCSTMLTTIRKERVRRRKLQLLQRFHDISQLMRRFLNKEMPAVPALNLACVDVRDVARAHLLAMQRPESDGERILAKRILGMEFNDPAVAIVEMGYSLIERGIVKKLSGYNGVPSKYNIS